MKLRLLSLHLILGPVAWGVCSGLLHAQHQAIPQSMVFTVGTTVRDPGGQDWAFLIWDSPGADLLGGRSFAVYGKDGSVNAATSYAREGIISGRLDPALLAPLLARAELAGQDLNQFDAILRSIYQGAFLPDTAPALSNDRAQRTAVVLSKATTSAKLIGTLRQIAMMNPTLALCLGHAWMGPMPVGGMKTYELREWTGADGAVMGRVTLTGGAPVLLPAPAAPVQLPDTSEASDLNVALRWGVTDELKRRIMLHQGFRVWRMSWAQAHSLGYDNTAPTLSQLQAHVTAGQARLVTKQPVFVNSPLSPAQAADLFFEPARSYITDDNGRFSDPANYVAPPDGTEVAYIVTARDVLGRHGLPSVAGRGQFLLKKRPPVPGGAAVEIVYGNADANGDRAQSFRFIFEENAANPANPTSGYEIYRGTGEIETIAGSFQTLLQHTGVGEREWIEATPPFNPDQQVWFCVRAVRLSPTGEMIYSDLSPPVYASLQKHKAPTAPMASVSRNFCPQPGVILARQGVVANEVVPSNRLYHFRMACERLDEQIAWAEFGYRPEVGAEVVLQRIEFAGDEEVRHDFSLADAVTLGNTTYFCRVSDESGSLEETAWYVSRTQAPPGLQEVYEFRFMAAVLSPAALDTSHPVSEYFLDREPGSTATLTGLTVTPSDPVLRGTYNNLEFSLGFVVERDFGGTIGWRSVGFGKQYFASGGGEEMLFSDNTPDGPSTNPSNYRVIGLHRLRNCSVNKTHVIPASTSNGAAQSVRVCLEHDNSEELVEYRVFRRVADGELSLVDEGRVPKSLGSNPICIMDRGLPQAGGLVTYYGQLIGRNGAGSALAVLDQYDVVPTKLPRPVLAPPKPAGTAENPKVRLNWSCPVDGVERFEISLVPKDNDSPSATNTGFQVSRNRMSTGSGRSLVGLVQVVPMAVQITSILTDRVGSTALGSGPVFTMDLDVQADEAYDIHIQARNAKGGLGESSSRHEFTWKSPPVDANVPWPFRALPTVRKYDGKVVNLPVQVPTGDTTEGLIWPYFLGSQVGFRIGGMTWDTGPQVKFFSLVLGSQGVTITTNDESDRDPNAYLDFIAPRVPLKTLPAVLYRQQLANDAWPVVSGDVVQVSPLVSRVLWSDVPRAPDGPPNDASKSFMRDPFIGVEIHDDDHDDRAELYLLDTTPRTVGAKYRYWLVRFDELTGSPDYVVPATLEEVTP